MWAEKTFPLAHGTQSARHKHHYYNSDYECNVLLWFPVTVITKD